MRKRIGYFCMPLIVLLLGFLLVEIVLTGIQTLCGIAFNMTYSEVYPILFIANNVCYVLVFGLWYGIGIKKVKHIRKSIEKVTTPRNILGIVVAAIGTAFFIVFGMELIVQVLPRAVMENHAEIMGNLQLGNELLMNIVICIIAPIGEELIFRGVMLAYLRMCIKGLKKEKLLFWIVNLIQALAFGAFHGNVYQFIYTIVLGSLLGYMVYKANTVLVSILTHMVYNTVLTLFMNAIGNALPVSIPMYVLITAAGFVVMMVGVLLVKRAEEEPEKELSAA